MPYVTGYAKVRVWVPPQFGGGGPPDWGIDEGHPPEVGIPGFPDQGLPPGGEFPGLPERPGQGLPRPPRMVYPILPDPDDMPGHPPLPDLDMPGRWVRVRPGRSLHTFPAWVVYGEPPAVDEDYEARPPTSGRPGTWVVIVYADELCWAWVPSVEGEPGQGLPGDPEREPKRL
jgi:hypothetical protein